MLIEKWFYIYLQTKQKINYNLYAHLLIIKLSGNLVVILQSLLPFLKTAIIYYCKLNPRLAPLIVLHT